MNVNRRDFTLLGLSLGAAGLASAQAFPSKPIKLLVGSTPGSAADVVGRLLAESMSRTLGQPVVVENRAGLAGVIALQALSKSAPDGYTLAVGTGSAMVVTPLTSRSVGYNSLQDFQPVSLIARSSFVLVAHPGSEFTSFDGFVRSAKKAPGTLSHASVSPMFSFVLEMIRHRTDIDLIKVNYKGSTEAAIDVRSGRVSVMLDTIGTGSLTQIQSGGLKPLAVFDDKRSPVLPQVPTVGEMGFPDLAISGWTGIVAPRGTPADVTDRLYRAVRTAMDTEAVSGKLRQLGMLPIGSTPQDMGGTLARDAERFRQIAQRSGIQPE